MSPFIKSAACFSRVHCWGCRTDQRLRDGWRRVYIVPPDFDTICPFGITLDSKENAVEFPIVPPRPKLPSIPRLGYNFAKAVARRAVAVVKGQPTEVSAEEQQRRLGLCGQCPLVLLPQWRCRHPNCGCWLKRKAKWSTEDCPENCWKDLARLLALQQRYQTEALPPEPPPEAEPVDAPVKPALPPSAAKSPPIPPKPPPLAPPVAANKVVSMEDILSKRNALTALLGEGQVMGTFRALDAEKGACTGCRRNRYFAQFTQALVADLRGKPRLLSRVRELFADREYIIVNNKPTAWDKV